MLDQHCIAETLSHSEAVETLRVLRTQAGDTSRSAFARHVCREFGFVNSRGQPQVASCQKALRSLHSAGRIDLPAPRMAAAPVTAVRVGSASRSRHRKQFRLRRGRSPGSS